jgi:cytochrome c-type biogenesis protein CcmH
MRNRFRTDFLLTIFLVLAGGCDRNTEPFVPGEEPRQPDLSRIFPESGGGPELPEAPASVAPAARGSASGRGIRGSVELAPKLVGQVSGDAVLFIIARRAAAAGGPPVAVIRVVTPSFPHAFEIGPEHVMMPGVTFDGELQLSARLDSDGNVMTRLPGDLKGEIDEGLSPGAEGVQIVLDQQL